MQQPQQVQTHHQVVEEIMPDQMSDEVTKEVINQFLPQRKRKPRQPKGKGTPQKMIKLEPQASGSVEQNVVTAMSSTSMGEPGSEMIVEEQEQVGEMVEQVELASGTGDEQQQVKIEDEGAGTTTAATGTTPIKTPKTPKDKSSSEFHK